MFPGLQSLESLIAVELLPEMLHELNTHTNNGF